MKKLWEYSGWYMLAVGIIHTTVGFVILQDPLGGILDAGIINSVTDQMDFNAAFWFIFLGFFWMYVGWQWQALIDRYREPLSKFSAWGLTILTAAGVAIVPMSGFWIIFPLCFIMLYYAYTFEAPDEKANATEE